jgi:hypothetical protein
MFYQYPWWGYYGDFSNYMSRLSHLLSGGRHVAKVAVLWPINAMFATYTPQAHNALGDRIERDFNTLTDLLLRLHYDFDYLDEDMLATSELAGNTLRIRDEAYELLVLPPMAHIKLSTLEQLEKFVAQGGRVLGMIFLPSHAFSHAGSVTELVDISERIRALFGVHPMETQRSFQNQTDIQLLEQDHVEREAVTDALEQALSKLIEPDITIDNREVFYLHRQKDEQDIYFIINPTYALQKARVSLPGAVQPVQWDREPYLL